jgi:hypothetical protein
MNFEKNISKSKLAKIERFYADTEMILDDDYYSTQLNVLFKEKGTEFYMKLPLKFKLGKSKINGSVNQTKIYIIALIIGVLISSLMYAVRLDVNGSIVFGAMGGFISYLIFRKNVKSSLNYFYESLLKILVLGYFFTNTFSGFSQSNNDSIIYHKPVFVNQCTGEIIVYEKPNKEDSTALLSEWDICYLRNFLIYKHDVDFNKDSVNVPKLTIRNCIGPCRYYYFCDSIANGYLEDYYYNGQVRIKGKFKNGQPIDTVFSYFRTEELKELEIPGVDRKIRTLTYYKNGFLKKDYNQIDGEFIEYYESGQIKEISKGEYNFKTKSYFQNGQVKISDKFNKTKIFNLNGKLREIYHTKESHKIFRIIYKEGVKLYNSYWSSFNSKGKLIRKIKFRQYPYSFQDDHEGNLSEIENQNFISIHFYKNGKKYKLIEYDYTKKAHFLYDYIKGKKIFVSKVEKISIKKLIRQIDTE